MSESKDKEGRYQSQKVDSSSPTATDPGNGTVASEKQADDEGGAQAPSTSAKKPVSSRKQAANRANAQKSTGPKTALGKSYSRVNALRHGMLANATLFTSDHRVKDPKLKEFYDQLCEENYGDDMYTRFLNEDVLIAYAGYLRGLECEEEAAAAGKWNVVGHQTLARYVTRHRNTLHQGFKILRKLKQERTEREDEEQAERQLQQERDYRDYCDSYNMNDEFLLPEEMDPDYVDSYCPDDSDDPAEGKTVGRLPTSEPDEPSANPPADPPLPAEPELAQTETEKETENPSSAEEQSVHPLEGSVPDQPAEVMREGLVQVPAAVDATSASMSQDQASERGPDAPVIAACTEGQRFEQKEDVA